MQGDTDKCRGEMLRKDNLNPSSSLAGSEITLAAPEETRRSFHGHSHESSVPLRSTGQGRAVWGLFASPEWCWAVAAMAQHHRPAPRTQADARTALMITDHSLWTPQSQNRLRNWVTPAQLLPFPSLGSKSWLCRVSCSHCLLRADRSPTRILHQEQGLGSD